VRATPSSPGSISTLIEAPPIDSDSFGAGVSAAAFTTAATLMKDKAATTIPTADLKLLKSIVAFFKNGAKRLAPANQVLDLSGIFRSDHITRFDLGALALEIAIDTASIDTHTPTSVFLSTRSSIT